MTSLDIETIQRLLREDKTAIEAVTTPKDRRGVQLGPLRWRDVAERCAARGCSSPTFMRVAATPYCANHALYALNYMVTQSHSDYEDESFTRDECTCNSGKYSMMNIHSADCSISQRMKGSGLDDHTS